MASRGCDGGELGACGGRESDQKEGEAAECEEGEGGVG